jgi:Flp pilus assembly protein TadD
MRLRGDVLANEARAAELLRAVEQRPDDVELRLELGKVLIALGRNVEALDQCEQAVRLAPDDAAALRGFGEALALNTQRDRALEVLQQVLERDPDDWQTHANVATLLEARDPVATLHHAMRAFQLQPNNLQTQLGLAEALALNGRRDEALRRLRNIARSLPLDDPFRTIVADRIAELSR